MSVDPQIQKLLRIPPEKPAVAKLIGMELASAGPGIATFTMVADERHHNPMGSVHGGILSDLADIAMGYAVITTLGQDETFTTLELKINYLRPVFSGKLRCVGRVDQRGKTIAYAVADVFGQDDRVVAKAVSTNLIISHPGDTDPFHHRPKT